MKKFLPLLTSLFVIAFSMAVSIPTSPLLLNWLTQKDISDQFPTAITPASFTFSIWSLIYLSWLAIGILIVRKKIHLTHKESLLFPLTMAITALWLVPWSFLWIGTAFLILVGLLFLLWYLFGLIREKNRIFRMTIELFMGWVHIATFANLAVLLRYLGAEDFFWGSVGVGIMILTIALIATLFFQVRYRTHIVSWVFLWAVIGIYGAHDTLSLRWVLFAYGCIVLCMNLYYIFFRRR